MNIQAQVRNGYANAASPTRTARGIEYDAIARITRRLQTASEFPALAGALHDNRKLWTIFASDVAMAGNPLPAELKARIVYLAEFTLTYTSEVLARRADIEPLVDINTAIMRGLRGGGA